MSTRALLVAAGTVALLAAAPGAAAQFTITIDAGTPAITVSPGESAIHPVSVTMVTDDNVVCTMADTIPVTVTLGATDTSLGLNGTVTPTTHGFAIGQGAYTEQTGAWTSQPLAATVTLDIGPHLTRSHLSHTYTLTVAYDGTDPANCRAQDFAVASASANIPVTIEHPALTDGPGGSGPSGNDTDGVDSKDGPALSAIAAVFVVFAAVALLRRR